MSDQKKKRTRAQKAISNAFGSESEAREIDNEPKDNEPAWMGLKQQMDARRKKSKKKD